ncbi:hypothetical protein FRC12_001865 [Ceratobasidium sp. 428]|nr:hypothetical protein FRC12_001865 [Ceratobasidium sp. 428]
MQQVIEAACDIWPHRLPTEDRIASRRLARQVQRANGTQQWVTLQPQRFLELICGEGEELELRLQIECNLTISDSVGCCHQRDESASNREASSREVSSEHSVNPGRHGTTNNSTEGIQPIPLPWSPRSSSGEQGPLSPISPINPIVSRSPISPPPTPNTVGPPATFQNAVAAFRAGKYIEARTHFQKAAEEFHSCGDVRSKADCLRHFGVSCRDLQDYVPARAYLLAARALYESIGAECRQEQLRCSRHIGRVEEDSGNPQLATNIYQQLIQTAEQEKFPMQHAWGLCYLGHLYNRTERYDEALELLKSAITTCREPEIEGFAIEESGYTAEQQGDPQRAMDLYKKALRIFKAHGEGMWVINEIRVKKRMDQLSKELPAQGGVSRRWSIGARLLNKNTNR